MPRSIPKIIKENMNILQEMMESGKHLSDPIAVVNQYGKCKLYRAYMNEEDTDYLMCAGIAIEDQLPWNVPVKKQLV